MDHDAHRLQNVDMDGLIFMYRKYPINLMCRWMLGVRVPLHDRPTPYEMGEIRAAISSWASLRKDGVFTESVYTHITLALGATVVQLLNTTQAVPSEMSGFDVVAK